VIRINIVSFIPQFGEFTMTNAESFLSRELDATNGILRLKAAFVARDFYPGLGRLGVKKYRVGKRGWICERWIASSVKAENVYKVENEGLSFIAFSKSKAKVSFAESLELIPRRMLGEKYAKEQNIRFGVLTKILDIGLPIPWHIHAKEEDAKKYWNMNGKEEAYYFLDSPVRGPLPYSHIGVHPDVTEDDLLPLLKRWNDDKVLDLSPAYRLNAGEGFHVFPGIPHAPGTALTLELQEESDVYNMLQAYCNGKILSRDIFLKGLPNEEAVADLIDWEKAKDPYFYRRYHTVPEKVVGDEEYGTEYWIFNPNRTWKFSGKELRVPPRRTFESRENGAYAILVWKGEGRVGNLKVKAGDSKSDELFVSYEAAVESHKITNTGRQELVLYKIFGPDVNRAAIIYNSLEY